LALKGSITLETKLVVNVGELAYVQHLVAEGPDLTATRSLWSRQPRWRGAKPTAAGAM
jgi:hypothetical protein